MSTPTLPQPPDRPSDIKSREAAQVAPQWTALRAANLPPETTDPHTAIARYQQFYQERGHLDGTVAVAVAITSLIAQLYWQNLNDRDKALSIYDGGIPKLAWHPSSARLKRERGHLQAAQVDSSAR
jgi:hypothetical protein